MVSSEFTLESLSAHYGSKQALSKITLSAFSNEILALIGPSGCGKSTLLRCLNRMNDEIPGFRLTGKICLEDQDIYQTKLDVNELRKHVGMVFQKPNPFPKSIEDNVKWGLRIHKMPSGRDVIEEVLRQAFLWDEVKDKLSAPALSLSGGQQQRLCIARALALKPAVLLLDEPCSALDPRATERIEELLLSIKKDTTPIIVTHNLGQARRVSDRTAFLEQGLLVEFDFTQKLFDSPREKRTADYVAGRFG